jgi:hypothetical protein
VPSNYRIEESKKNGPLLDLLTLEDEKLVPLSKTFGNINPTTQDDIKKT